MPAVSLPSEFLTLTLLDALYAPEALPTFPAGFLGTVLTQRLGLRRTCSR